MGISQQVGSSSLNKPGVCTSTTRPATPYEGQCVFETDTDRMYIWNGTAWVIPNAPAQNPTGLELVTTATCSSGGTASGGVVTVGSSVSSVVIDNAFSSTYDNYRISMSGGVGSTPAALTFKLGASSTGYYFSGLSVLYSADTLGYSRTNNGSTWDVVGGSYVDGARLEVDLVNPFVSARKTGLYMYGLIDYRTAGSSRVGGAGFHNVADSYTGFTIGVGAGTLTGGTIRVYGYRNS